MSMRLDELKKVYSDSRKFTCIDASKNGYKAIHIYLRESNYSPSREVQIWNQEDISSNISSHAFYKQDYCKYSERE